MKKSKLFEILKVLSNKEWEEFGYFLESPLFQKLDNRAGHTQNLYAHLSSYYPDIHQEAVTKAKFEALLFPNSGHKNGRIEKVMSSMVKQLEWFIILKKQLFNATDFQKNITLSKFYQERNLKRLHDISIAQLEKRQAKIRVKGKEQLYEDYLLEKELSEIRSLRNPRNEDLNFQPMIFALDQFFLASRLEHATDLLSHMNFHVNIQSAASLDLISKLIPFEKREANKYHPIILIYEKVYQLLQSNESSIEEILRNINDLESLLKDYRDQVPELLVKRLCSLNRNQIGKLVNLGHEEFLPQALKMYKDHYANKLLNNFNGIPAANFKNMVSLCLRSNDMDWVYHFIEENKNNIVGTENAKEVYAFNLAKYYFHNNEIEKANDHLAHNFEDMYYKIGAKRLEIKILFAQKSELLEYKINAFKLYIHRLSKTLLPEISVLGNNNFINILKQIIAPTNINPKKKKKIQEKILGTEQIYEKEWLLSIISPN